MENSDYNKEQVGEVSNNSVIPVIEEQVEITKEVVETGKVVIRTRISEEETTVNVPVVSERFEVKRVPVNEVYKTPPPIRHEGNTMIVPVVEEIVVVEKRYKVSEEVHLVKQVNEMPFMQDVSLQRQDVIIERITSNGEKSKL